MPLNRKEMGNRIKRARELKTLRTGEKFTQSDLALMVNKSRSYIGDLEAGRTNPSVPLLSNIAKACEVPFSFFDVEGFGTPIKDRRESLGLSVEEVAHKSQLPLEMLQKIENNEATFMALEKWERLGNALNIPGQEIYRIFQEDVLYRIGQPGYFDEDLDKVSLYVHGLYKLEQNSRQIDVSQEALVPIEGDKIVKLPIIGSFAAGQPIIAIPEDDESFPFDTKLARVEGKSIEDYFYLRVKGDSMEPNLKDGDIALIRKQPIVDNGQIAAVLCDDETVACKRVSLSNGNITLYSDNPIYPPMVFKLEQCLILGRVIGHYRKD